MIPISRYVSVDDSSANEPPKTLTADAANAIPITSEAEGNHDTPATRPFIKICPDPEPLSI